MADCGCDSQSRSHLATPATSNGLFHSIRRRSLGYNAATLPDSTIGHGIVDALRVGSTVASIFAIFFHHYSNEFCNAPGMAVGRPIYCVPRSDYVLN